MASAKRRVNGGRYMKMLLGILPGSRTCPSRGHETVSRFAWSVRGLRAGAPHGPQDTRAERACTALSWIPGRTRRVFEALEPLGREGREAEPSRVQARRRGAAISPWLA